MNSFSLRPRMFNRIIYLLLQQPERIPRIAQLITLQLNIMKRLPQILFQFSHLRLELAFVNFFIDSI